MADIDMIPRSYRDGVRLRRTLRRAAGALALVVLGAGAGHALLRWRTAALEQQSTLLRAAASAAQSDLTRIATERAAAERTRQRAAVLDAVRRQGELAAFALTVDGALPADTWLSTITLRRNLRVAPAGAALPAGAAAQDAFATGSAAGDLLLLDSNVELSGQAASYGGITDFLAALGRAPNLKAVQLQSSSANPSDGAIDFHATLSLVRRGDAP